jgi:hypothetical protein
MREKLYPDLRRNRAMAIVGYVQQALEPWIARLEHHEHSMGPPAGGGNPRRDINRVLFDLFYTVGAEIITEADRINAGLDPRDRFGLTARELSILDQRLARSMLETFPPMVPAKKEA